MTFIQARNYQRMSTRTIDNVVAHSMENDEKPGTALAVAQWFSGPKAPMASAHSCIDNRQIVNCVRDQDIAYAAPGLNHNGYHIEHPGRARQSRAEWMDTYSLDSLKLSSKDAARVIKPRRMPLRFVNAQQLRNGAPGVTTHLEVTNAFHRGDHWDPGQGFPMDVWLKLIDEAMGGVPAIEPRKADDLMEYRKIDCPTGGYWLLHTPSGGIGNFNDDGVPNGEGGAPFFGSVAGVDPDGIDAPAVDLAPYVVDGIMSPKRVLGYWIVLSNGQTYAFGEAQAGKNYDAKAWGQRVIMGIRQVRGANKFTFLAREAADPAFVLDRYTP